MAMLLAMYQKLRLIREKNQLSYEVAGYTGKIKRLQTNIKIVQKMYAARLKNLENMAKYQSIGYKQTMQMQFNFQGLVAGAMEQLASGNLKSIWDAKKNNTIETRDGKMYVPGSSDPIIESDMQNYNSIFAQAQNYANQQQSMMNMNVQNNEMMINAQLEEAKAQIEDEQDMALEPLQYEETMMEEDKAAAEQKLGLIDAELQSYEQLCQTEAKNAAPKFGLG